MPDETTNPTAGDADTPTPAPAAKTPKEKPAGATEKPPKKEKPPALEDKPFPEFMTQHFIPGLQSSLEKMGIAPVQLSLEKRSLPIQGMESMGELWQVVGQLTGGRNFLIGFLKDDIQSQKVFAYSDSTAKPSTLESFMIDERKVTLDLLLLYAMQRLNGQKWLVRN